MLADTPPLANLFLPENIKEDYGLFKEITESELDLPDEQAFYILVNPSKSFGSDLLFIMPDARRVKPVQFGKKHGWVYKYVKSLLVRQVPFSNFYRTNPYYCLR